MLDFHNHLMPGVDDGASDEDEARKGLAVMVEQGVLTILTTPHVRASLTLRPSELERYLGEIDQAYDSLTRIARENFPDVRIERGVEIMLDIPGPHLGDPRLRLAGTSFALFEFPFMSVPPHSTTAIREVRTSGVIPVIAHPERYSNMASNFDLIMRWTDAGAMIQVNSGSLTGQYGSQARTLAWRILEQGWAHYLSSDYHSRGRCAIRECASAMRERGAEAQLEAMTVTNPGRLLNSELPLPVDPVEEVEPGFWKKVFR